MSSDDQYTALGPAIIGFQTHGAHIEVGADVSGIEKGLVGTSTSRGVGVTGRAFDDGLPLPPAPVPDGIVGVLGSASPSIIGPQDPPSAVGVQGDGEVGVRGECVFPAGYYGVWGINNQPISPLGPADGFTRNVGVRGDADAGTGVSGHSNSGTGVIGESEAPAGIGVEGTNQASGIGVAGFSSGELSSGENLDRGGSAVLGFSATGSNLYTLPPQPIPVGVWGLAMGAGPGVLGQADADDGVRGESFDGKHAGVAAVNHKGGVALTGDGDLYGAQLTGRVAPLRLVPSHLKAPNMGVHHQAGELFVNSVGDLYFCKVSGSPGTWFRVQLVP